MQFRFFPLAVLTEFETTCWVCLVAFTVPKALQDFWDGNWADPDSRIPDPETNELSRRLLATGHALEWWAMAPQEIHPPRETIVRAAQWLAKTILEMDERSIEKNYTFLTHAARSLVLWRGKFADEINVDDLSAIQPDRE